MSYVAIPISDPAVLGARLRGSPLVLMLDIDGTLTPLRNTPEETEVSFEVKQAITRLARCPAVHAAVITGRSAADAQRLVPIPELVVIGNHGAELVKPGGAEAHVHPDVAAHQVAVARARLAAEQYAGAFSGVRVEDKRWTLSVHYRLADPAVVPALRARLDEIAAEEGLQVFSGKTIFELRPAVAVNKGTAALQLARDLEGLGPGASLFFAGDDVTDEDAFRELRRHAPAAVTVRVSHDPEAATAAEFLVADHEGIRALLEWLADFRGVA